MDVVPGRRCLFSVVKSWRLGVYSLFSRFSPSQQSEFDGIINIIVCMMLYPVKLAASRFKYLILFYNNRVVA